MENPTDNKREYLHSISRFVDRIQQTVKDVERIERNCKDLRDDLKKIQAAAESFMNDNLTNKAV